MGFDADKKIIKEVEALTGNPRHNTHG